MYKLTLTYEEEGCKITHEIDATNSPYTQMIQSYVNFLRGIGYVVPEDYDTV